MSMGSGSPLDALIFHLCLYYSCFSPSPGPCHPNPCHNNGECQLVPNRGDVFTDYICKCPAGYDGVHCQNSEYIGGQAGEACPLRAWGVCAAVTVWGIRLCQGLWAVLELAGWREGPWCGDRLCLNLALNLWRDLVPQVISNTRGASRLSLLHAGSQH